MGVAETHEQLSKHSVFYGYVDDLLVSCDNRIHHEVAMKILSTVLNCHGRTISSDKCKFGVIKVNFLGVCISNKVMNVGSKLITSLCSLTLTSDRFDLCCFFGLCQGLLQFIQLLV